MISLRAASAWLVLLLISAACSSTTTITEASSFGAESVQASQPGSTSSTVPTNSDVATVAVENPTVEPIGELVGTQAEFDMLFTRTDDVNAIAMIRTASFKQPADDVELSMEVEVRSNRTAQEALYSSRINGDFISSVFVASGLRWRTAPPFVARASAARVDEIRESVMDPGFYLDELQSAFVEVISATTAPVDGVTEWQVELSFEGVRSAAFTTWLDDMSLKDAAGEVVPAQLSTTADGRISEVILDFSGLYEPRAGFDGDRAHQAVTTYRFYVLQEWSPLETPCDQGEAVPGWSDQFECSADLDQIDLVAWERAVLAEAKGRNLDLDRAGVAAAAALNVCGGTSEHQSPSIGASALFAALGREPDSQADTAAIDSFFDAVVESYCAYVPALPVRVRVEPHSATSWEEMIAVRYQRSGQWASVAEFELSAVFACSKSRAPVQQFSNEALFSETVWDTKSATELAEIFDIYESGDCELLTSPAARESSLRVERELISFVGQDLASQATQTQRDCVVAQVASRGPTPAGINAERIFIPVCAATLVIQAHAPLYENDIIDPETGTCIATALAAHAGLTYEYYWGDQGPVFRSDRLVIGELLKQACTLTGAQLASLSVLDE